MMPTANEDHIESLCTGMHLIIQGYGDVSTARSSYERETGQESKRYSHRAVKTYLIINPNAAAAIAWKPHSLAGNRYRGEPTLLSKMPGV